MKKHARRASLFLTFALLGCANWTPPWNHEKGPALPVAGAADTATAAPKAGTPVASPDYRIGPEDVLEISVWKEEGLKKEVLVRPDGGITFPLVGDVFAMGKTAADLQGEITQRLTRYIPKPVVSVSVLKIVSNKIYVVGKVTKPGEFVLGRHIDVMQALSMAGGLTPFAQQNEIKILRKENGKDIAYLFDYQRVQDGSDLSQNIVLKSGDTVVVP
jgi:polysaccharide export outer membrane protein